MTRTEVTMDPVRVMYVEAKGGLSGVGEAWSKLESNLSSLKGRKMYGAYYDQDKVYRACVAIINEEEPRVLGLPSGRFLVANSPEERSRTLLVESR